jgi:phage tail sheath protein FI
MPVTVTYPGVYVQEVPSGVHTIAGVSTSVALFIGRTMQGPLEVPTPCFSLTDFSRTFSMDTTLGDMPRAVYLFYANGGTQAWIMRVAKGAHASAVNLLPEDVALGPVLTATAVSAGLIGNSIRIGVTPSALDPEGAFNLEIFSWGISPNGTRVKNGRETYTNLSMDPKAANYCVSLVNSASHLVELTDIAVRAGIQNGFSRSGRPLSNDTTAHLEAAVKALITPTSSTFQMSVDGGAFVSPDLSPVTAAPPGQVQVAIQNAITLALSGTGAAATVTFDAGPSAPGPVATAVLRITSSKGTNDGSIRIVPAAANDVAVAWMLGPAQGGLEVSPHAPYRPAPTGVSLRIAQTGGGVALQVPPAPPTPQDNLVAFGALLQNAINAITIGGKAIPLGTSLQTVGAAATMFMDANGTSPNGNSDGIREKLAILANAINAYAAGDPTFVWQATVAGDRLFLSASSGGDDDTVTVATAPNVALGNMFEQNVRYYSLGNGGASPGNFQAGWVGGGDGNPVDAPYLQLTAFPIVDKQVDLFNLMVLPRDAGHTNANALTLNGPASVFCQKRRALLLVDAPFGTPGGWKDVQSALSGVNGVRIGVVKDTAALYMPRLQMVEGPGTVYVGASGAMAGVMARIDGTRGVWKAPAGIEADIRGIVGVEERFTDDEHGALNPRAINIIRVFPNGIVSFGARTMDGDDDFASEYKYVPIRRLAYFMEESLYRGLKWVVFEPNDEPLWSQIRLNVGSFMQDLFRKGAFQGATPQQAYFVKCDGETTTETDRNLGMVNIWVGFAPLKPAEFVILYLQQMAGQTQV